ncbi:unnamed protein product [Lupinus luteus]|uniref:Uncharacterized protein n=1 Tax=Lupinus luteus TaxID=3873 RepID=A0AAV1WUX4_LUPLU
MDFRRIYSVSFLILVETQISGTKADKVMRILGFDDSQKVDACRRAGGIWVLWDSGFWKFQIFQNLSLLLDTIPREIINKILAIPPPSINASEDCLAWSYSKDGDFTVSSAYSSISNHLTLPSSQVAAVIWG